MVLREPDAAMVREVERLVDDHRGTSIASIRDRLAPDVSSKAKNLTSVAVARFIDAEAPGLRPHLDERILRRVVRADEATLRPREPVSFSPIDFMEVIETPWSESPLRKRVARMLFIVLLAQKGAAVQDAYLHSAFAWEADRRTLATMEYEYERFRRAFAEDDPVSWPRPGATEVLHVRPHGRDGKDVRPLPDGRTHVRSSFWLNQPFVQLLIRLNQR
jgi:DNA mismatch repair protein MutH